MTLYSFGIRFKGQAFERDQVAKPNVCSKCGANDWVWVGSDESYTNFKCAKCSHEMLVSVGCMSGKYQTTFTG